MINLKAESWRVFRMVETRNAYKVFPHLKLPETPSGEWFSNLLNSQEDIYKNVTDGLKPLLVNIKSEISNQFRFSNLTTFYIAMGIISLEMILTMAAGEIVSRASHLLVADRLPRKNFPMDMFDKYKAVNIDYEFNFDEEAELPENAFGLELIKLERFMGNAVWMLLNSDKVKSPVELIHLTLSHNKITFNYIAYMCAVHIRRIYDKPESIFHTVDYLKGVVK